MLKLVTRLTLLGVNLPKWPVQPKSACGKNFQKLFFSHVHTVTSNLVLQCTATIIILCIGETHNLINYVSFINYLSYGVTIAGLLYYRWRKPNLYRPIKVNPAGFYYLLPVNCSYLQLVRFHWLPIMYLLPSTGEPAGSCVLLDVLGSAAGIQSLLWASGLRCWTSHHAYGCTCLLPGCALERETKVYL